MTLRHLHSVAAAACALLIFAGGAAAQDKGSGLLNSLEVRTLVTRGEPADEAKLSAHFTALAAQYTAEAARHTSMSKSFVGNPNRSFGQGMSVHCRRLADLNTQSAATAKELAEYHDKLASGTPAIAPADAAKFHGGKGAPEPSRRDLSALAARASTPSDHRALEEYFTTLASRYASDASEHAAFAAAFRGTKGVPAAAYHDRLAGLARDSAKEATAAAEMHKALAGAGR